MNTFDQYPIGFNAIAPHGQVGDEDYYVDVCKRLQSSFQLVISNPVLASRVFDECDGTEVIYRDYKPDDNSLWRVRTPESYGDEICGFSDTRLWLYGLNEPNPVDSHEVAYRNQWLVGLIDYVCGARGRKLVVGNFASGSWQLPDIDAGLYDGLLSKIDQYRDICHLGLHEYAAILMPMTYDSIQFGIANQNHVQPEQWLYLDSDNPDVLLPDYRQQRIDWYYHLFRSNWLQHRCVTIGIDPVPIVLTEYGTDRLQDVDGQNGIYEYFKNFAGVPEPYAAPHGFYSNYKVWEYYFPNWDVSEALFHQLKWSYLNYDPDWYKGILLFDWGYDTEFASRGFNLAPDTKLHELLIADARAYRNQTPPEPEPEPEPMPTVIDMLDYMRGDGRIYDVSYHFPGNTWEHGSERMQTQTDDRRFFHVKGAPGATEYNWEELWYDNAFIWRGTDISPGNGQYYQVAENGQYGQKWIPRFVRIGDKHLAKPMVTFRHKHNCQNVANKPPYLFHHWIEVKAIHSAYTFEQSGLTLNNVVELWGYLDDNGQPGLNFERYFYAKNYGLVKWQDPTKNWESWLSSPAINVGMLPRQQLSCLDLPPLPPLSEPEEPKLPDLNDPRWKPYIMQRPPDKSGNINIRVAPTTASNLAGVYSSDRNVYRIPELDQVIGAFTWHVIKFSSDPGTTFNEDGFTKIGYVRNDVADFTAYVPPEPEPPSEPDKQFLYIPLPELAATQQELDDMATVLKMLVRIAPLLHGLATILENWDDTTSGVYDGIAIIPEENEETP